MSINYKYVRAQARAAGFLIAILTIIGAPLTVYASATGYNASGVIGQTNFTSNGYGSGANQLEYPSSTAIDTVHHLLFVSDTDNYRVLVYQLNNDDQRESSSASYALGATSPSSAGSDSLTQTGFEYGPNALAYDPVNNRLFVMDYYRVLVFDLAGGISNDMPASYVLGQPNFTTDNDSQTQTSLDEPGLYGDGLAFDSTNDRLFVSDYARIMVFNVSPSTISDGEPASNVLGQTSFTGDNEACTQSELYYGYYDEATMSLAFDNANQRLFVSDGYECNRVLVFNVAPSVITDGEDASYVLGQPNFTTDTFAEHTQSGFYYPGGLGYDPNGDTLFVQDYYGARVMLFNVSPSVITNDENAYAVIGQPNFTTYNLGASQSEINYSYEYSGGFAVDPTDNELFLPDQENNRILTFNFVSVASGSTLASGTIGSSYSQTLTTTDSQGAVTFAVTSGTLPQGLSLNGSTGVISGTPTTAGTYNFEITAYDNNGTEGTFVDDPSYTITIDGTIASSPDTGYGMPNHGAGPSVLILSVSTISLVFGVRILRRGIAVPSSK